MIPYCYIKAISKPPTRLPRISRTWQHRFSSLAILAGLGLFGSAAGPIISYELFTAPRFQPPELIAPAAANQAFVLGDNSTVSVDLTKINSWFPTAPARSETSVKINTYTLSIPKLRIADSSVKIGGEDLAKSLVHYAGTALPGQPGNAVIIGHSVLPQFFDPKNYLSIFSTLPRLRPGDDFFISYDGIQYRYVVEDMVEVDPTNFTVLEQRFDDAFATLITCVPPGLKTKRLAVRARLVNNLNPI